MLGAVLATTPYRRSLAILQLLCKQTKGVPHQQHQRCSYWSLANISFFAQRAFMAGYLRRRAVSAGSFRITGYTKATSTSCLPTTLEEWTRASRVPVLHMEPLWQRRISWPQRTVGFSMSEGANVSEKL
jgi:hypothetical protein